MPAIEVDIEIFCARCGAGICNNATPGRTKGRGQPTFEIEPCQKCLSDAEKESYDKGYDEGHDEGHDEGLEEGRVEAEE